MPEQHTIVAGKVQIYKRPNNSLWQCSTILPARTGAAEPKKRVSRKPRKSPRTGICSSGKSSAPVKIKTEKTFREVSEHYLHEYEIMTPGQRNRRHVEDQHRRSRLHLLPFFRNLRRLRARPQMFEIDWAVLRLSFELHLLAQA